LGALLWSELSRLPGVRLWGLPFTDAARAPTVSFTAEGHDPAALARALGAVGICVWDGNFYAPRPVEILQVPAGSLVRVGFSMYNSADEAMRLVAVVRQATAGQERARKHRR
jgi:selenocysteine lyase/cysteine desulfurase